MVVGTQADTGLCGERGDFLVDGEAHGIDSFRWMARGQPGPKGVCRFRREHGSIARTRTLCCGSRSVCDKPGSQHKRMNPLDERVRGELKEDAKSSVGRNQPFLSSSQHQYPAPIGQVVTGPSGVVSVSGRKISSSSRPCSRSAGRM